MPLYEYACGSCGHRFERIQKFSDPPVATCPECGGAVEKLISSPAIQFKGTGWYITDYARSGGSGKGTSEKSEKKDETAAAPAEKEKKTESAAPAADTSAKPAAPAASTAGTKN